MTLARIENGAVVELRNIAMADVPAGKRPLWRELIGDVDPPDYDPRIEQRTGPIYTITDNGAVVSWEVALRPDAVDGYSAAIQQHIDETARAKGYADGVSLASYVMSTNAVWAAEASAFVAWRDSVWTYAYAELAKVQSGQRERPDVDALLAELPSN